MRQSLFFLFLLATLPVGVDASGASLLAEMDQVHDDPGGFVVNQFGAQVFTVGRAGILDRVEVPLRPPGILDDPLVRRTVMLRLARTDDGVPHNLRSYEIISKIIELPLVGSPPVESEVVSLAGFQWVSLNDIGLQVSAGDQYAIEVRVRQIPTYPIFRYTTVDWGVTFPGQLSSGYPDGEPWRVEDTEFSQLTSVQDFCFRTYVRPVPEPAASVVGVVGMIGIGIFSCRKKLSRCPRVAGRERLLHCLR